MSSIEYVDRHEAKIRSITMEAPEGYEFGHIVKAEVEMRVGKLEYTTDKEGNVVRTAVMAIEGCEIKVALDPATAFAQAQGGGSPASVDSPDDDDDDDVVAAGPSDAVSSAGTPVDPDTGEFAKPEEDREPATVGAGGGIDPEVGF